MRTSLPGWTPASSTAQGPPAAPAAAATRLPSGLTATAPTEAPGPLACSSCARVSRVAGGPPGRPASTELPRVVLRKGTCSPPAPAITSLPAAQATGQAMATSVAPPPSTPSSSAGTERVSSRPAACAARRASGGSGRRPQASTRAPRPATPRARNPSGVMVLPVPDRSIVTTASPPRATSGVLPWAGRTATAGKPGPTTRPSEPSGSTSSILPRPVTSMGPASVACSTTGPPRSGTGAADLAAGTVTTGTGGAGRGATAQPTARPTARPAESAASPLRAGRGRAGVSSQTSASPSRVPTDHLVPPPPGEHDRQRA